MRGHGGWGGGAMKVVVQFRLMEQACHVSCAPTVHDVGLAVPGGMLTVNLLWGCLPGSATLFELLMDMLTALYSQPLFVCLLFCCSYRWDSVKVKEVLARKRDAGMLPVNAAAEKSRLQRLLEGEKAATVPDVDKIAE